ncbi:hypothetical protein CO045_00655 [Candidatus Peregrinibacteria bacterium CG_4_9_14_0_2_um_filter_41_14]|nr:MAG: hypothetical protein COY06_00480 [Candidatus Peregrinibacteria bacterium CG_4_10_14_0_2_um_filter_41_8]PJC38380.1 MAG: hypothetical protein CO045_00655 [Candidatus Peregrinibacteria bacterium CG_4_9_14_0_2_um_filter_41_14]
MNFRSKRIRKHRLNLAQKIAKEQEAPNTTNQKQISTYSKNKLSWKKIAIIIGILLIPLIVYAGFDKFNIANPIASTVLKTVGKTLPTDAYGYTNFLLLGTGDVGHEGQNLTDTIIVASFNPKTKQGLMFSIPRDLYIKADGYYGQKINSLFANALAETNSEAAAYKVLESAVTQITNRPIHRRILVTFSAFENIVDEMGGITFTVPEAIYDTSYPNENYGYQTFKIDAGLQTLDGATALKYARSRHTSNDYARSRRQQDIILALKENAKTSGILTSPGKISAIYEDLKTGIKTNLETREIIQLAGYAAEFDRNNLLNLQLHDDPSQKGGFLYTPPRYLYNNTFVLLPLGNNYNIIHKYLDLHYEHSDIMNIPRTLQILNGTPTGGLASSVKAILQRFGFVIVRHGNATSKTITTTTLYNKNPLAPTKLQNALKSIFNFTESNTTPPEYLIEPYISEADYILELGADSTATINQILNNQYVPPAPPDPAQATEPTESTEPTFNTQL